MPAAGGFDGQRSMHGRRVDAALTGGEPERIARSDD
jgi:hypothetical protein